MTLFQRKRRVPSLGPLVLVRHFALEEKDHGPYEFHFSFRCPPGLFHSGVHLSSYSTQNCPLPPATRRPFCAIVPISTPGTEELERSLDTVHRETRTRVSHECASSDRSTGRISWNPHAFLHLVQTSTATKTNPPNPSISQYDRDGCPFKIRPSCTE